jgi:dTDP-4-dehydrorhamnose 3,5-epimerase
MTTMAFRNAGQSDARLIALKRHSDSRGEFARTWSTDDFRHAGIAFHPVEANVSRTHARGTIRGMHFQRAPREEAKLVRCARGTIWDVITDLRPRSPTRRATFAYELSDDDGTMLFIPAGYSHGFQTLTDDVTVESLMGERYAPALADCFRYDDPAAGIAWPLPATLVSERDLAWPPLAARPLWRSPAVHDLAATR